jgi:phosphate transport system substrate-binding protein
MLTSFHLLSNTFGVINSINKTMKINALVFASLLLLAACGSNTKQSQSEKLSGTIKIDGSSTVYPVTEAVA